MIWIFKNGLFKMVYKQNIRDKYGIFYRIFDRDAVWSGLSVCSSNSYLRWVISAVQICPEEFFGGPADGIVWIGCLISFRLFITFVHQSTTVKIWKHVQPTHDEKRERDQPADSYVIGAFIYFWKTIWNDIKT